MPFCYHSRPATDNNTYWNCDKPETLYTRLRSISKKAIRDCCKLMRWFIQCMTLHRANDAQTKWFISMSEICNELGKSPERFWRLSAEISSMNGPFFDNAQKHAQWIESRLCGLWSNLSEWQINSGKPISNVVLIWTLNLYLLFNIIRQRGTHVFWCRTNSKQRTKSAALEKCACYEASESTNVRKNHSIVLLFAWQIPIFFFLLFIFCALRKAAFVVVVLHNTMHDFMCLPWTQTSPTVTESPTTNACIRSSRLNSFGQCSWCD